MEAMMKEVLAECDAILQASKEYAWFKPICHEVDVRTVYYMDATGNVVAVDYTTGEICLVEGGTR